MGYVPRYDIPSDRHYVRQLKVRNNYLLSTIQSGSVRRGIEAQLYVPLTTKPRGNGASAHLPLPAWASAVRDWVERGLEYENALDQALDHDIVHGWGTKRRAARPRQRWWFSRR